MKKIITLFLILHAFNTIAQIKISNSAAGTSILSFESSGSNVVWCADRSSESNHPQIYFYDGDTAKIIEYGDEEYFSLGISGNNMVWGFIFDPIEINYKGITLHNGYNYMDLPAKGNLNPQISGKRVVWQLCAPTCGIQYFNGTSSQLIPNSTNGEAPQISGTHITFVKYDGNDREIFYFDGTSTYQITNNDREDTNPKISGNKIVWQGFDGNDWEIFHYNGTSTQQLTNNIWKDFQPLIDADNITWTRFDGQDNEILYYNGLTNRKLTDNQVDDSSPQIVNNRVVWSGFDGNDSEIFLFNGQTIQQITNNSINDISPKISKDKTINIVWKRNENGADQIYFQSILDFEAPGDLIANAISESQIKLRWVDNNSSETSFKVQRSSSSSADFLTIATLVPSTSTFTDSNLSPNQTYYYRIITEKEDQIPFFGNVASASTGDFPIVMNNSSFVISGDTLLDPGGTGNYPTDQHVTMVLIPEDPTKKIGLKFLEFKTLILPYFIGKDELYVYDGGDTYAPLIGVFSNSGLPPSLIATNPEGRLTLRFVSNFASSTASGFKAYISCVDPNSVPLAPTSFTAKRVSQTLGITLTWQDEAYNEAGFKIERSSNPNSGFTQIAELKANVESFEDKNISSKITYFYRIIAFDVNSQSSFASTSAFSGSVPFLLKDTSLVICDGIFLDPGGYSYYYNSPTKMVMTLIPGEEGRKMAISFKSFSVVYYSHSEGYLKVYDGPDTTAALVANLFTKSYNSRDPLPEDIIAKNPTGQLTFVFLGGRYFDKGWEALIKCIDPNIFNAPVDLIATSKDSYIDLNWTDETFKEERFELERSLSPETDFELLTFLTEKTTNYKDYNLEPLTPYYYRIRAYGKDSKYSEYSNIANGSTQRKDTLNLTCNGIFSGPESSDKDTTTILFPSVSGQKIKLSFTKSDFSSGNIMKIYDGPSDYYPLIGTYADHKDPFSIVASSASGALTIKYLSLLGNQIGSRWVANVSCIDGSGTSTWARKSENTSSSEVSNDIIVDPNGNSYVVGTYTGSITFGSSTLYSYGNSQDGYLVKYDGYGNVMWARSLGGSGIDEAVSVAYYEDGIVVTGYFSNTAEFGALLSTSKGGLDIFLVKYNQFGNVVWVKSAGGTQNDIPNNVSVDRWNRIYVTGSFTGNCNFSNVTLSSAGGTDVFIVRYNSITSQGIPEVTWARKAGGAGDDMGAGVDVDENLNIYVTGNFSGTATFETNTVTSAGGADIFLSKYGPDGALIMVKRAGGAGNDFSRGIAVAEVGDTYLTGSFTSAASFDGITLTSAGGEDLFIAKYNNTGTLNFAVRKGGSNHDGGKDVAIDGLGNIYTVGWRNSITPYNSVLTDPDVFMFKFDNQGIVQWLKADAQSGKDFARGIAADPSGYSYVTGIFSSTLRFGQHSVVTTGSNKDIFVAKIGPNGPSNTSTRLLDEEQEIGPENNNSVVFYPNPSEGIFYINSSLEKDARMDVYSINGALEYSGKLSALAKAHPLVIKAKGLHLVKITSQKGVIFKKLEIK